MTREDALDTLNAHLDQIRQYGVEKIGIFGSVARSEADAGSDIDLLVGFLKGQKSFDHFMDLREYLESLFSGHKVDLVIDEALKPRIRASVYRDAVYVP